MLYMVKIMNPVSGVLLVIRVFNEMWWTETISWSIVSTRVNTR